MLTRFTSAAAGLALVWLVLLGGVHPLPTAEAAEDVHVDAANHFTARIPAGWYPIRPELLAAAEQEAARLVEWKNFRYVGGYSTSPQGDITFPYVLLQITDAPMNQVTEAEFRRGVDVRALESGLDEGAPRLSEVMSNMSLGATWDASRGRLVVPLTADVAGVGPTRGLMVAQVGSHGLVQVNCYARAAEFAASMADFEAWADGVQIDPGYEWQPGSEPSVDAAAVGSVAVLGVLVLFLGGGVILVVVIALTVMIHSRKRRRRMMAAPAPGMMHPVAPVGQGPSKRWGSRARPLVDINAASAEELVAELGLPGEWAAEIVQARASLGYYRHPEQLYSRAGLPYDLYVAVVERVTVSSAQPAR